VLHAKTGKKILDLRGFQFIYFIDFFDNAG